ncbi:MAG: polyketide synthase dehydratase domain-containing protein [Candidatus Obscuribacterales bacterium]|nr:polyketide synthase dehydratase domain-containing protein [Candidatus Obscuribacterales bacterium]
MSFTISSKTDGNQNSPEEGGAETQPAQARLMPTARSGSAARPSQSARDQVMIEFQRTSLDMASKFLETQQRVMLAYLGQASGNSFDAAGNETLPEHLPPVRSIAMRPVSAAPTYQSSSAVPPAQTQVELAPSLVTPPVVEQVTPGATTQAVSSSPVVEALDAEWLIASLIEIVSERTGYPTEMLDPQLDLEADLGIDSIKRVEILNTFRKLLPEAVQHSLEDGIERLAGVKTLQGIMDWIRADLCAAAGGSTSEEQTQTQSIKQVMNQLGASSMASLRAADLDFSDAVSPVVSSGARLRFADGALSDSGSASFTLVMESTRDLFMKDHTFDGVPVMPMAFALELMCEAAVTLHPNLSIVAVTQMEIPAGIVFESAAKTIVVTVQTESAGEVTRVSAAVCTEGAFRRAHFKAVVELAPTFVAASLPPSLPSKFAPIAFADVIASPTASEVYSTIMFHGPLFQGITSVTGLGANGVSGELKPTAITDFIATESGARWEVDPVVLDSAMQLAGVWGRKFLDVTLLPAGFSALRKVRPLADTQYHAIASMPPNTAGLELQCDLAVYSSNGELVLFIEGLKGIGTKALNRLSSK